MLAPRRDERRMVRLARGARGAQGGLHTRERSLGRLAGGAQRFAFTGEVGLLHVEARERLGHPFACRFGALDRVPQRRGRVDRRKDLLPGSFDVALEAFQIASRGLVSLLPRGERLPGGAMVGFRLRAGLPARLDLEPGRLPAFLQRGNLGLELGGADLECGHLLPVQLDLLLLPLGLELAGMRRLARGRGARLRFGQLDSDAAERALDFGHATGCRRFARTGIGQATACRVDDGRELAIPSREEHFLPAAQLVAETLVPAGLRRLPFQGAPLLLDLEDDVVDAREVLLRGLELQLGRPPARLVFGDAGRFLDQLPPIRRARTQDQPDLALLDDGVRLCAEPRIHQELVHVPQAAHLSVDEVLAVARSIQPPNHLDLTPERRRIEVVPAAVHAGPGVVMPVAIAVAVSVGPRARRARDARQEQPHLGRPRRLAGVAAAEDHILHLVATKALGALLAEHPRDGIRDVALATAVRPDDGRDAFVEGELGAIRKRLEPGDFEALQPHGASLMDPDAMCCSVARSHASRWRAPASGHTSTQQAAGIA